MAIALDQSSSEQAHRAASIVYNPYRRLLLESYGWYFAVDRATLLADASSDVLRYRLPADFASLYSIDKSLYVPRMNYIYPSQKSYRTGTGSSGNERIFIEYVSYACEADCFSELFTRALTIGIAVDVLMNLSVESNKVNHLLTLYKETFYEATLHASKMAPIKVAPITTAPIMSPRMTNYYPR